MLGWFKFGGEFADEVDEADFQEENWSDILFNTRLVLTIGSSLLTLFLLLELFSTSIEAIQSNIILAGIIPVATSLVCLFLVKNRRFQKYISQALFILALVVTLVNSYVLFSGYVSWSGYLLVILGQLLFFAIFMPNRYKYTLASVVLITFSYIFHGEFFIGGLSSHSPAILTISVAVSALIYKYQLNKRIRRDFKKEKELITQIQEADYSRGVVERAASENIHLMEQLSEAEKEAKETSQFLRAVLDHIHQGIVVYDKHYCLVAWNYPYERLMDFPEGFLQVGKPQIEVIKFNAYRGEYGEDSPEEMIENKLKQIRQNKGNENFIYDRKRPNGAIMNIIGTSLPDGGIISSYTDVTKEREREEETRLLSLRDNLTKLANRRAFTADMSSAVRTAKKSNKNVVLAMLDLDNFKPVNDTYGHPAGDEVLRQVAGILKSQIRGTDSAARLGGDEFAIVFREVENVDLVRDRVKSIIKSISEISIDGVELPLGASAGLAQYPDDGDDVDQIVESSDQALYAAKGAGKNNVKAKSEI